MWVGPYGPAAANCDIIIGIMKKVIITVVGKDTVGILAKTCTYLAKENINILDISQTVTGGFFNMMMIVAKLGTDMGMHIRCQKSEIFEKMHRV